MPLSEHPGQDVGHVGGLGAGARDPPDAARPRRARAGEHERPRSPIRPASAPAGPESRATISGPGANAMPACERRVAPDVGQEQRRCEQQREEAHREQEHAGVGHRGAGRAQQRRLDHRRGVARRADGEAGARPATATAPRRAPRRSPSPTPRPRRSPSASAPTADHQQQRAGQVGPPRRGRGRATRSARRTAATAMTRAERQVDQEDPTASSHSTSRPPTVGPSVAATAAPAVQSPTAAARRSGGNSRSSRASEVGIISAAPTACTTRARDERTTGPGAAAQSADASDEHRRARPGTAACGRAGRRAARPGRAAPRTRSRSALSTHCRSDSEAAREVVPDRREGDVDHEEVEVGEERARRRDERAPATVVPRRLPAVPGHLLHKS